MAANRMTSYWKETRRPVYSAAVILPFFIVYHLGTFLLRTTYINGADALIMRLLAPLSVHTMFASALALAASFLVWQVRSRASWKVQASKLIGLFVESLLFGLTLFLLLGWLSAHLLSVQALLPVRAASGGSGGPLANLVLYCGAGIYEELLFRGFLLGSLFQLFRRGLHLRQLPAAVWSTAIAAVLFSLFHYVGPAGDPFTLASFFQRSFAGVYFSVLFIGRSFGVAAASHALYDILVGLWLAL